MAVDKNGYITCSKPSQQPSAFSQVINDVITRLNNNSPELIRSLYLYGSAAEGQEVAGSSDLDMTIVFTRDLDQANADRLDSIRTEIEVDNPVVSKIDFDSAPLTQVLNPKNQHSWGYWLKHHCLCVYCEELSRKI